MKFVAYIFAGALFVTILISPVVELLGAFADMCRINAGLVSSSRAALQICADNEYLRDAQAVVNLDKFEIAFRESFCTSLKLKDNYTPDYSRDCTYERFIVGITPKYLDDSGNMYTNYKDINGNTIYNYCEIEVITNYKFKTGLMKKFASNFSNPTKLRVKRTQVLKLDI